MEPVLTCFKEVPLDDKNKFVLDFSNGEIIKEVNFLLENNYHITSLHCGLILKEHNHDKKN